MPFSISTTEAAFIVGIIISSAVALHQWYGKRKVTESEVLRNEAQTASATAEIARTLAEADAQKARSMVEIVSLMLNTLATVKGELTSEIKGIGTALEIHAAHDVETMQGVTRELQHINDRLSSRT